MQEYSNGGTWRNRKARFNGGHVSKTEQPAYDFPLGGTTQVNAVSFAHSPLVTPKASLPPSDSHTESPCRPYSSRIQSGPEITLHSGCEYWEEIISHLPGCQCCKRLRMLSRLQGCLGTMEITQLLLLSVICLAEPTLPAIVNSRRRWPDFPCGTLEFSMRFQPEHVGPRRARTSSCLGACL